MTLIFVKLLISQVSTSNQMRGKWPLFDEFSFFSKQPLTKTVFGMLQIKNLAFHIMQKNYLDFHILLESEAKQQAPNHQVLMRDPTHGTMAHLCGNVILQQMTVEKFGFHCLKDWLIVLSGHIKQLYELSYSYPGNFKNKSMILSTFYVS